MDWLMPLLTDTDSIGHILLVYSVVIALGMALGRIKVFGISLGVTFVLFVALAVSYAGITVNGTVLNFLRDFGLILFVFFIGLQVGPSFFSSFKSGGLQLNLLTLLAVGLSILVTIALFLVLQGTVTLPQILGVHYGAVTNTPGLGATQEALDMLGYKGENIAIAYACAYPLGVVGIITSAVILRKMFRINLKEEDRHWDEEASANSDAPIFFHVAVTNAGINGQAMRTATWCRTTCCRSNFTRATTAMSSRTAANWCCGPFPNGAGSWSASSPSRGSGWAISTGRSNIWTLSPRPAASWTVTAVT